MNISGWIQLALYVAVLLAITKPLGLYLCQVLDVNGKTFLDPVIKPLEKLTYKLIGVDPNKEHDWKQYAIAMLVFSLVSMLFTYGILRLQDKLPLNPQKMVALSEHLAFNTAASFTTNTNWQSYGGESTMSYLSQMLFGRIAMMIPIIALAGSLARKKLVPASAGTFPVSGCRRRHEHRHAGCQEPATWSISIPTRRSSWKLWKSANSFSLPGAR